MRRLRTTFYWTIFTIFTELYFTLVHNRVSQRGCSMRRPPPSDFVAHGGRNRNGEHELLNDDDDDGNEGDVDGDVEGDVDGDDALC